jgi:hypothetical protein
LPVISDRVCFLSDGFSADKEEADLGTAMERSEIAETICEALSSGHVAASLASVVDERAKFALISGSSQPQALSGYSHSAKYFQGFIGLRGIAKFCRDALQISSGDLTGCVIRGDCVFAFGTIRLQAAPHKKPPETHFAGKLIWKGIQIIFSEFRIMWPFPPDVDPDSSRHA